MFAPQLQLEIFFEAITINNGKNRKGPKSKLCGTLTFVSGKVILHDVKYFTELGLTRIRRKIWIIAINECEITKGLR